MSTPILSKDSQRLQGSSGPLTPSEQQQQEMQQLANMPGFQQFMQTPILSKDSERLQGVSAPLSEEDLDFEAVKAVANNPRFQQFMQNPILSKDSQRLQGLPETNPKPQQQTVSYMDPMYGQLALAGMGVFNRILNKRNEHRALEEAKKKNMADWFGTTVPGSRGKTETNLGVDYADRYTPVQFRAYPRGPRMMAEGGDVDPLADVREVPGYFDETVVAVPEIHPPASTEVAEEASTDTTASAPAVNKGDNVPTPKMDVFVTKNSEKAVDYYVSKGIPVHIAAGIGGNTNRESGTDARRLQNNGGPGTGIAQWGDNDKNKNSGGRWNSFLVWAKDKRRNPYRLETQLDYILEEPGWGPQTMAKLMKTKTPEEAALVFGRSYEKPSEKHAAWDERAGAARKLYERYLKRKGASQDQAPKAGRDFDLAAQMGLGNMSMDMGLAGGGSSGDGYTSMDNGSTEEPDNGMSMSTGMTGTGLSDDDALLSMVMDDDDDETTEYERGGEYLVTPKQLKFILAYGGEVEFL